MGKIDCRARNGAKIFKIDCYPGINSLCIGCPIQKSKASPRKSQSYPQTQTEKSLKKELPQKESNIKQRVRKWIPDGGTYSDTSLIDYSDPETALIRAYKNYCGITSVGSDPQILSWLDKIQKKTITLQQAVGAISYCDEAVKYADSRKLAYSKRLAKTLCIDLGKVEVILLELETIKKIYLANKDLKNRSRKLTKKEIKDIYSPLYKRPHKMPVDRGGRPDEWPLKSCIIHLASIFERITGEKARLTRDPYVEEKQFIGPFPEFVLAFWELVEPDVRLEINIAMGKQIENTLKLYRAHIHKRSPQYLLTDTILS